MRKRITLLVAALTVLSLAAAPFTKDLLFHDHRDHLHKADVAGSLMAPSDRLSDVPCEDGMAGPFECDGVDLLSFVPDDEMFTENDDVLAGGGLSDIWGWVDPETDDEYVIFGKTNGAAFYRVTDPTDPVYLGEMPNTGPAQLIWYDIKVDGNYAYIVSETPGHGLKVFDLTLLRDLDEAPVTPFPLPFVADYPIDGTAHNIVVNPDTDTAYLVGSGQALGMGGACDAASGDVRNAGLHMIDISNPQVPTYAGCYFEDAYIHDAQCAIYAGPDAEHHGKEICVTANEDSVSVVDVTDRANPVRLGHVEYDNVAYAHQGWLDESQEFFYFGDELDEQDHDLNTRTLVFDVRDLDAPALHFEKIHDTTSIDHNMYTKNGLLYQSNYTSGLRVLDTAPVAEERQLPEVASFDTFPDFDRAVFEGTWSNFPYFPSGTVAVTGIGEGLFLLKVQDDVLAEYARTVTPVGAEADG